MAGITAKEIIDKAITLEEGSKIVTQCNNFAEMNGLRANLYKARKILLKSHKEMAYSLYISRKSDHNNFFVIVEKEKTLNNVLIINKEGKTTPFTRNDISLLPEKGEKDRLLHLMKQDGLSEEEIADNLAEQGEIDFDTAAAKIEAMQEIETETEITE